MECSRPLGIIDDMFGCVFLKSRISDEVGHAVKNQSDEKNRMITDVYELSKAEVFSRGFRKV